MMSLPQARADSARSGSPPSFEEFVRANERRVILAAYRITRNIDDARDVAQFVFMQVHLNLREFDDRRAVDRWLYVVTRNEALNIFRRRRRDDVAEYSARNEEPQPGLEETVLQNERVRQVRATIALLPSAYRDMIELRHLQSMPTTEIAQTLNVPVTRVKRDVERAKTRLRIEMMRRGLGEETARR